jgi:hypothetical protein
MEKFNLQLFTPCLLFGVVLVIIVINGCKRPDNMTDDAALNGIVKSSGVSGEELSEMMITLGNQLENPYSVTNMLIAYRLILQTRGVTIPPSFQLAPTHYYVRFLPASDEELDILKRELNLELSDYPIDFEIVHGGSHYHDPSIPEGDITWQYTSVPVNYNFPNIQYEILENLLLVNDDNPVVIGHSIYYSDMETLSLQLTNNYDSVLYNEIGARGKWNPSGKIRVWDHVVGGGSYIPLEGVKVVVNHWFHYERAHTNQNGDFSTSSFKNPVHYKIKWESDRYDIRSGTFGQAVLKRDGKHSNAWNLDISKDKAQMYYATVHRGAYRYQYQNIGNLRRPGYSQSLKYCVYDKEGDSNGMNWPNIDPFGILPDIQIWAKDGGYRQSNWVFSTTIHETAHASHRKYMTGVEFKKVKNLIIESWARAVEWRVSQIEYNARGIANYDVPNGTLQHRNIQNWNRNSSLKDYSPLFIDLIDDFNQALLLAGITLPTNRCPNGGTFDGANCHIASAPTGTNPFIYSNNFYYTPLPNCNCPVPGTWYDGANCFVRNIPNTVIPFIYYQGMYFKPTGDPLYPYDDVKGYTLANIESNMLKTIYNLTDLSQKLKQNKPSGVSDRQIDILITYYSNL